MGDIFLTLYREFENQLTRVRRVWTLIKSSVWSQNICGNLRKTTLLAINFQQNANQIEIMTVSSDRCKSEKKKIVNFLLRSFFSRECSSTGSNDCFDVILVVFVVLYFRMQNLDEMGFPALQWGFGSLFWNSNKGSLFYSHCAFACKIWTKFVEKLGRSAGVGKKAERRWLQNSNVNILTCRWHGPILWLTLTGQGGIPFARLSIGCLLGLLTCWNVHDSSQQFILAYDMQTLLY
jgi:hypothetical protein